MACGARPIRPIQTGAMNVTETLAQDLKREYKVVIPAQDLAAKYSDKLAKLSQNVRLPGFRPGKVPTALLRKRYGMPRQRGGR